MSIKSNRFFQKTVSKIFVKKIETDLNKRIFLLGLGTMLGGCSAPQPPQKEEKKPVKPVKYLPPNEEIEITTDGQQSIDCAMCSPGVNPPIGGIGAPPGQTTPPGGINPPVSPGTDTPGSGAQPALPTLSIQTFSTLGPSSAVIQTSDMMGGLTQTMSNGAPLLVWGFTALNGGAFNGDTTRLCPGPVIEMIEGQPMMVELLSSHPHTIHLHGLDVNQANDGVPSTSGYVARVTLPALTPPGVNLGIGGMFTYEFTAPQAGTYLYHCHVDTVLHMEMGMSGTIIVRPPDSSRNRLYTNGPSFDREYIWQLHTFDSSWRSGGMPMSYVSGPSTTRYSPDYFMINGRDGTDILVDATSAIEAYAGQRVLIRLVNLGYMPAMVGLGGIPFEVVASDGRPLKTAMPPVNEWLIAPGERYDVLFTMPLAGQVSTSVNYLDISGQNILGSAISTITTL